jgi:hypothetical protein
MLNIAFFGMSQLQQRHLHGEINDYADEVLRFEHILNNQKVLAKAILRSCPKLALTKRNDDEGARREAKVTQRPALERTTEPPSSPSAQPPQIVVTPSPPYTPVQQILSNGIPFDQARCVPARIILNETENEELPSSTTDQIIMTGSVLNDVQLHPATQQGGKPPPPPVPPPPQCPPPYSWLTRVPPAPVPQLSDARAGNVQPAEARYTPTDFRYTAEGMTLWIAEFP